MAADFGPGHPRGGWGADLVRHAADPLDAGDPVYLPVPLFPQFDVLSGGAFAGAGHGERSAPGQAPGRCTVRSGAGAVCVVLPGPLRPAHRRLACRPAEHFTELWILLTGVLFLS